MRVLLIGIPALLCDILRSVAGDDEFVEADDADSDLVHTVGEVDPDVVLVAADDLEIPRLWQDLLATYPDVRVVAVASRGRHALVCEVTPELSAESLADAVGLTGNA